MQVLSTTQRKCVSCGAIINYSKHDIDKIPENPMCGKCARGEKKTKGFKPVNPFGGIDDQKEETETTKSDTVPMLRESVSSGKRGKDNN